jgi:hypothetical protein
MGKYQFGKSTLRHIGVYNFKNFLNNPILQENAFYALLCINKWELRKEIKNYSGRIINGIKITESGLLAAAHLSGASSVKAYLRSNGKNGFKDVPEYIAEEFQAIVLDYVKSHYGKNNVSA